MESLHSCSLIAPFLSEFVAVERFVGMGRENHAALLQLPFQLKEFIEQTGAVEAISSREGHSRSGFFFELQGNVVDGVADQDRFACVGLYLHVLMSIRMGARKNAFDSREELHIPIDEFDAVQIADEPRKVRGMTELAPVRSLERHLSSLNEERGLREQWGLSRVVDVEVGFDDILYVFRFDPLFFKSLIRSCSGVDHPFIIGGKTVTSRTPVSTRIGVSPPRIK